MSLGEFVISFEENGCRKYAGPYKTIECVQKDIEIYKHFPERYSKVTVARLMYDPYNPILY